MDLKIPIVTNVLHVRWTMQGLHDGAILNIIGCCNFTETESREVCTVLLDKGLFLYNQTTLAKKRTKEKEQKTASSGPQIRQKTVNREYRSSLSLFSWSVYKV